jgi:hypothetical protein
MRVDTAIEVYSIELERREVVAEVMWLQTGACVAEVDDHSSMFAALPNFPRDGH